MTSPLHEATLWQLGPVPVTGSMLTSCGITLVLGTGSFILRRRLRSEPGKWQAIVEVIVTTLLEQIEEVTRRDGRRYLPLLGSLFLFLLLANSLILSSMNFESRLYGAQKAWRTLMGCSTILVMVASQSLPFRS